MNKLIVFIFLAFAVNIYPQSNYENNRYYYWTDVPGEYFFEFNNGVFTLFDSIADFDDPDNTDSVPLPGYEGQIYAKKITGKYSKNKKNGFEYIMLDNIEFLVLYSNDRYCVLYANNSEKECYYGLNEKYINSTRKKPDLQTPEFAKFIKYGSSLSGGTRNGISYQPPFGKLWHRSVWAYSGKSNWITLSCSINTNRIYFINGMVYPSDMNFFSYNNRVKTIKISYNNKQESFILNDTASPQIITLKEAIKNEQDIKIEIIDVYPGTRYDETVISFIGFIRNNFD